MQWKQSRGCLEQEMALILSIIVTMTQWCPGGRFILIPIVFIMMFMNIYVFVFVIFETEQEMIQISIYGSFIFS